MKRLKSSVVLASLMGAVLYLVVLKPRVVRAYNLTRGSVVHEAMGSGSIESRRMVGVGFEVTARVEAVLVDQGDTVKEGQELARLDDKTFQAEVESARQEVALATSTLARLQADIARAQAVLKGAQDNLMRIIPLAAVGTASEERLDISKEREKVAIAELASAEAALAEGQAATSVAQGKLERVEVELARTILLSPFDGTVILREREVGDVAVPGSPILRLAATDTIWSSVWVDETHLASLREGLTTRVVLRSDPQGEMMGHVARIGREVDRETRELLVDIVFDTRPKSLVLGQRVDVWIELARATDVLRLPAELLVRMDGQQGVFVEENGRARFRPIELGLSGRGEHEVKGGLELGQVVLVPRAGKWELKQGARIELADMNENSVDTGDGL